MERFYPGMWVEVEGFGTGVVIRSTWKGVLVSLDRSPLKFHFPAYALTPIDTPTTTNPPVAPRLPAQPEAKPAESAVHTDCDRLRTLEALRFGLVPERHISQLTIGYDHLAKWVEARMPDCDSRHSKAYQVSGFFGTGKSHTMTVIRHIAQQQGYVTARVELDGRNISLSNPSTVLNRLWTSLQGTPDCAVTSPLDLYLKLIDQRLPMPRLFPSLNIDKASRYYEVIRNAVQLGVIDDVASIIDSILTSRGDTSATEASRQLKAILDVSARESKLPSVVGRSLYDARQDFLESLVSTALLAQAVGLKGLVITLDEFETEYTLDKSKFARIGWQLNTLRDYLAGQTNLRIAPLALFFATVGQDGPTDPLIDDLVEAAGGDSYLLSSWTKQDFYQLARRIFNLYSLEYGVLDDFEVTLAGRLEQLLSEEEASEEEFIRAFIKRFVGLLDRLYGPPGALQHVL